MKELRSHSPLLLHYQLVMKVIGRKEDDILTMKSSTGEEYLGANQNQIAPQAYWKWRIFRCHRVVESYSNSALILILIDIPYKK